MIDYSNPKLLLECFDWICFVFLKLEIFISYLIWICMNWQCDPYTCSGFKSKAYRVINWTWAPMGFLDDMRAAKSACCQSLAHPTNNACTARDETPASGITLNFTNETFLSFLHQLAFSINALNYYFWVCRKSQHTTIIESSQKTVNAEISILWFEVFWISKIHFILLECDTTITHLKYFMIDNNNWK